LQQLSTYYQHQYVTGEVVRIVWPPQSPDLNPIEAMWDYVDSKIMNSTRTSQNQMWEMVQEAWNAIPKKFLQKYIFSMKKRCQAVIAGFCREGLPYPLLT
jgi:hypothetical protein